MHFVCRYSSSCLLFYDIDDHTIFVVRFFPLQHKTQNTLQMPKLLKNRFSFIIPLENSQGIPKKIHMKNCGESAQKRESWSVFVQIFFSCKSYIIILSTQRTKTKKKSRTFSRYIPCPQTCRKLSIKKLVLLGEFFSKYVHSRKETTGILIMFCVDEASEGGMK